MHDEVRQAPEAGIEGDLGHAPVRLAEEQRGLLEAQAPKVSHGRLADADAEQAREMEWRQRGRRRERREVEIVGEVGADVGERRIHGIGFEVHPAGRLTDAGREDRPDEFGGRKVEPEPGDLVDGQGCREQPRPRAVELGGHGHQRRHVNERSVETDRRGERHVEGSVRRSPLLVPAGVVDAGAGEERVARIGRAGDPRGTEPPRPGRGEEDRRRDEPLLGRIAMVARVTEDRDGGDGSTPQGLVAPDPRCDVPQRSRSAHDTINTFGTPSVACWLG